MNGRPVWLASLSYRTRWGIVATGDWSRSRMNRAQAMLRETLGLVGDMAAERHFRMNATLCIHRALTPDEEAGLPADFHACEPIHIAGGPVEILWENVAQRPSCQPCVAPGHGTLDPFRPDLWIPRDCGECEPCRARAAILSYHPELALA